MEKIRVYELAKEMNTTSKRLMEKLAEIDIHVKNHMSLLEAHELEALYKHIGVIKQDDRIVADPSAEKKSIEQKTADTRSSDESKKTTAGARLQKTDSKAARNAPRIIRTTEIYIDSRDETKDTNQQVSQKNIANQKKSQKEARRDYVKASDANSGLRAGFVRNTDPDYTKLLKKENIPETQKEASKDIPKDTADAKEQPKETLKEMQKETTKKDASADGTALKTAADEKMAGTDSVKAEKTAEEPKTGAADKKADNIDTGVEPDKKDEIKTDESLNRARSISAEKKSQKGEQPQQQQQQADKLRGQGNRQQQQGEKVRSQVSRPQAQQGDKNQQGQGSNRQGRQMEISKHELSMVQQEEISSQKSETRREYSNRDQDRDIKREQRRESPKQGSPRNYNNINKKFKHQSAILGQKKGISEVLSEEFILDEFYDDESAKRKKNAKARKDSRNNTAAAEQKNVAPAKPMLTSIKIPEMISIKDLAEALKKSASEVIKKLLINYGMVATLNQEVDFDTATLIADEFGVKTEKLVEINEEDILFDDSEDDESQLVPRPPVVVVMGHVDHGKTSLLDAIRHAHVTDTEEGGITQHIGAYSVTINNRKITFLDTPGHEAFTAMRARGAQITDIAILVVAADDGVMPQTIEAINHARAANVTIIVAINKIDKPTANPERVKQELAQQGLVPEEWGGDVIFVPVSAKNHQNIDQLLEMVLLTADILELKANPNRQAKGTVIEAKLDKHKGPLATVLVQRGTLRVGDSIVTGTTFGRVRAMMDDKGDNVEEAGPSTPVEILGLPEVPEAGELFYVVQDEKVAKHLVEKRKQQLREKMINAPAKVTLEDLYNQIKEGKVKELEIIIKADVQGSVEALKQALEKLSNDEVRIKIIHGGVGAITESDVQLAGVSNAIIVGFNVRPGPNVAEIAKDAGVEIKLYTVIYKAIEDIESAIKGMLEPTYEEVVQGHAEIRQIFKASGVGTIGGAYVTDGKIVRNSSVRVLRDNVVIYEGKLASLKRFKDDVKEVVQGFECGLAIEKYNDIKEGDIIECYTMEEVQK